MAIRVRLTKLRQLEICSKHEEQLQWTYHELAKWARDHFRLQQRPGKSSIARILKNKHTLAHLSADCLSRKELRSPHMLRLDAALVELIIYAEQASMPISGRIVMTMARKLARELKIPHQSCPLFTRSGWLRHFLARYNLHPKRSHGEIGSVDVEAVMQQLETLHERIRQFHPSNVSNMDETALYYKATPRTSVVLKKAPALKQDKSRVTMVVGANADGTDKLPLVFLGKAANPRWLGAPLGQETTSRKAGRNRQTHTLTSHFTSISTTAFHSSSSSRFFTSLRTRPWSSPSNASSLYARPALISLGPSAALCQVVTWLAEKPADVQYIGTTKGWMAVGVCQAWLRDLDERMAKEDRKILLLVDNAPVHIHRDMNLRNVSILKLPPNTTALFQPMDQGVIAFLKHAYMNIKDDAAVDKFLEGDTSPYQASLLDGIEWCRESWGSVPAEVIKNCWKHAQLFVDRSQVECVLNK